LSIEKKGAMMWKRTPVFFQAVGNVEDITSLLERVKTFLADNDFDSVYLRGQSNFDWGLRPTISRPLRFAGFQTDGYRADREQYLLNRFRRYIRPHLERDVSERELMFLARHHGVPVRVLDWTSNPLVALYFACEQDSWLQRDGAIWAFLRKKLDHGAVYDFWQSPESLLDLKGVRIIYAPYVSVRIPAQSCYFTIQSDPNKELQIYDPADYPGQFDIVRIEKWRIPRKRKPHLLRDLERVGINEGTLFPDLDGIARGLVRTEVLRKGTRIPG
jgi:hypothetical protein